MVRDWSSKTIMVVAVLVCCGCQRANPPKFVADSKSEKLSKELQSAVHTELVKYTGSYLQPKFIAAADDTTSRDIKRGQAVYQERCVQCHGVSGDGAGPMANSMYPRPRDYRKGLFKFTSTPYGSRPLREDLLRTVKLGIRGTSMPGFALLAEQDLQSVVDYVILLARRGELEQDLINNAMSEDEIVADEVADDLVPTVIKRWAEAEESEVMPLSSQPKLTQEHVNRGKKAFLTKGCSKCHGEDGRGQTVDNRGTDLWGQPTRAADLTSGMLHGGPRPIDIYRRIFSGINGTPMPGFANSLKEEPETIWDLVAYVTHVSGKRRHGEMPVPGPIKPYLPSVETQPAPPSPAGEKAE